MSITITDITWWLSGGASNTDPDASIGGAISTVGEITSDVANNLFDDVSGAEAASGDTEYRCFFIKNSSGTDTWESVVVWINANTPSTDDTIAIALTTNGKNNAAETPGDESTPPSGPTFSTPTSKGTGLSIGDLSPGDYYAIWVKRTVDALAGGYPDNSFILEIEGETT